MAWRTESTFVFDEWVASLARPEQDAIVAAIEHLERDGPGLGRPLVDTIKGSRHRNMKELRPLGGHIRILFAFDPRRSALLLLGGDKTNRWQSWYREMIPIADRLYDDHLERIRNSEREGR